MKCNMRRRVWMSLALAAALLILPASNSYAVSPDVGQVQADQKAQIGGGSTIDPQYVNAARITADIDIEGGTAYCYASAAAKRVCRVTVTMRLQRKENGTWKTKVSWVGSSTNGVKTMSESFKLSQRGSYRTYAVFDVGGESLTYKSITLGY